MLDAGSKDAFRGSLIFRYLPTLNGSRVLIFPWDISYSSVGHFTTVPLFAIQAYTTYTQYLDQQSAARIKTASPPIDYVLWEWKSIDSRHPLLDDPAIWNAIYSGFSPVETENDSLLLKRRAAALPTSFRSFKEAACPAEEWIAVPERHTPVALSLNLKPTLAGGLTSTLYQIAPISLEVKARSGTTVSIRIPPDVMASPFPINYLPLNPLALNTLWTRNTVSDPIVAFRLTGPGLPQIPCRSLQFYDLLGTQIEVP